MATKASAADYDVVWADASGGGGTGVPDPGWSVTAGYTADKTLSPESGTIADLSVVLSTLIDALKTYGILAGGAGDSLPNPGWSVAAYVPDKTFDPQNTTVIEIARVVGTLIDALKTYGVLTS